MKSLAPEADADLEYDGDKIRFQDFVITLGRKTPLNELVAGRYKTTRLTKKRSQNTAAV